VQSAPVLGSRLVRAGGFAQIQSMPSGDWEAAKTAEAARCGNFILSEGCRQPSHWTARFLPIFAMNFLFLACIAGDALLRIHSSIVVYLCVPITP
jgi:hypothetical protein